MEKFTQYKPYLEEFNYPNIYICTDEQIINIFSAKNRQFLLTWFCKMLNSQFVSPTEWSPTSEALYADFFHENGFCNLSQKEAFVKGDLDVKEQEIIFNRIFNYLKNTAQQENIDTARNEIDIEDLESFLMLDINLFPSLGPLKLSTTQQKQLKLKYLQEEITKLKHDIENQESSSEDAETPLNDKFNICEKEHIEKNIEKFREQTKKLKETCGAILKNNMQESATKKMSFKGDIGNSLEDCKNEIGTVLQYFKDINLIQAVNMKQQEVLPLEQNEIAEIIKEHSQASYEIVKLKENINKI